MAISQIPTLIAYIWFLLWELICGRPSVGRSTSHCDFTDSYSESSYLIPTETTHMWQTKCRQIYPHPPQNGNFTDYYSEISMLRAHIWQTRFWQIYLLQLVISQIPTLRAHICFLLWELTCGRPSVGRSIPHGNCIDSYCESSILRAHMWQTRCRQIYPPRMTISQIPTLRANISFLFWQLTCGRPSVDRSTPWPPLAIIDSYFESSYLADQV